ncbi:MAG TPA: MFS transporter [Firmicutes bacterium]|nr:MFS transporter [Bacillota bacterium]
MTARRQNAFNYLAAELISAAGAGISSVLFPLFLLAGGFKEDFLGLLASIGSGIAGLMSLPASLVVARLGYRRSILIGMVTGVTVSFIQVLWPTSTCLIATQVISGCFSSLSLVIHSPYLVENAGEECGTRILSLSMAGVTIIGTVFNIVGGWLPARLSALTGLFHPDDFGAYRAGLLVACLISSMSILPAVMLKEDLSHRVASRFRFGWATYPWLTLAKVTVVSVSLGFGAGLFMPFMNVYWKTRFSLNTELVGIISAATAGAVGLGATLAPVAERRLGLRKAIPILTGLSLFPMYGMIGSSSFRSAAWLFLTRTTLVNATSPLRMNLTMEVVESEHRPLAASVESLAWSLAWAAGAAYGGRLILAAGYSLLFRLSVWVYAWATLAYPLCFGLYPPGGRVK